MFERWQLMDIIGNIIAKYADEIDLDSLPDTDVYFQKWYIYESYNLNFQRNFSLEIEN